MFFDINFLTMHTFKNYKIIFMIILFYNLNLLFCSTNFTINDTKQNALEKYMLSNEEITFNIVELNESSFKISKNLEKMSSLVNTLTDANKIVNNQYSKEIINETNAIIFKNWLESRSSQLFELNLNYSGFKILNKTYNYHLSKDAKFAWINFTEMIINISSSISEVLYNKTIIVKNLSDSVEKAFDKYINNSDLVINSTQHVYYDSKSPKSFCDVLEEYNKKNKDKNKSVLTTSKNVITTTSKIISIEKKPKFYKRFNDYDYFDPNYFLKNEKFSEKFEPNEYSFDTYFDNFSNLSISFINFNKSHFDRNVIPDRHHNELDESFKKENLKEIQLSLKRNTVSKTTVNISNQRKKPSSPNKRTTITTTTTTTTPILASYDLYDEDSADENEEDNAKSEFQEDEFDENYWDIACINRTYDENFKSVQRINRNRSTVQVPINVFKQDIAINMTAFWTELLDEQFKKNYDNDNELFWQYFCSTQGLFRRYPAAYWSVSQKDFFDCRLQTWYIMAAASPKDVIILLDTSGSMTGLRLEIGKKLIEFILDTFSDNDFFNILTFSNSVQYLFHNESDYIDTFIQAGKENKLKFKQRLNAYKNTSQQARLTKPLEKVFNLFSDTKLVRSGCNKMIMIITDGHADDVDEIFNKYNNEKRIRVFSFKIGRDMTDPSEIKKLACNNNGEYYHVVTLTDINEHVYEYIPVLSRPMALSGVRETTWSNVFIGYLDKELKIAVARPAFRDTSYNYSNYEIKTYKNTTLSFKIDNFERHVKKLKNSNLYYIANDLERRLIENAEIQIRKQQALLGVVGVDVPVLRLISKVSPKYQMGVGIYIIMLDNNGFIVFHPSIKKEIAVSEFDFKGTSHSIDLDKFEIPIDNDEDFEELEHEMIDQITSNKTLDNWKREGLRVIRRRTEYVYTPVSKTPFSVAIASPNSFGRYYIDLPSEKESEYEKQLKELVLKETAKNRFFSNVQLYNCSYSYIRLSERLTNPNVKQLTDYCIRYLYQDIDQVLAIKSDLLLHNIYYNLYNFSVFNLHRNLVLSSFYGTYSGITFYLPVTFYRNRTLFTSHDIIYSTKSDINVQTFSSDIPKEILNETLSRNENFTDSSLLNHTTIESQLDDDLEAFNGTYNLFSTESNKHTYSFEKQYYTRSIEFSDYLRTEFKNNDETIVIYFLNETSKDAVDETISAAMPIWFDKVPTAVAGVVYDAKKLQDLLFNTPADCNGESCSTICNQNNGLNITCYLVDEHAIVVLTNSDQSGMIGKPLYKINPWLMFQLEIDGLYDLIVTGNKLQDCTKPPITLNRAIIFNNFLNFILKGFFHIVKETFQIAKNLIFYLLFELIFKKTLFDIYEKNLVSAQISSFQLSKQVDINQNEWRIRNSHCFYFGIYSFNITKWKSIDPAEKRTWCNSTTHKRHYLAGYLKHSNLLMLAVEDESEVSKCGSIEIISKNRPPSWNSRLLKSKSKNNSFLNLKNEKRNYTINRYRKNPEYCHNFYPNESETFFCRSSGTRNKIYKNLTINMLILIKYFILINLIYW